DVCSADMPRHIRIERADIELACLCGNRPCARFRELKRRFAARTNAQELELVLRDRERFLAQRAARNPVSGHDVLTVDFSAHREVVWKRASERGLASFTLHERRLAQRPHEIAPTRNEVQIRRPARERERSVRMDARW